MENGFIVLSKKLISWEWYTDIPAKILFLHCLLKANWEDKKWQGETIKRGSFITSKSKLSKETGLSIQQVRTALEKLEATNNITSTATNKFSLVTVANYNDYQNLKKPTTNNITSTATNEQQTSNKQITNKQQTNNKHKTDFPTNKQQTEPVDTYSVCDADGDDSNKRATNALPDLNSEKSDLATTTKPLTNNHKPKELKDLKDIYSWVVNCLNEKAGTNYKATSKETQRLIDARVNAKFTYEDFEMVINKQCVKWVGTEWEQYLRPSTLFGTKFESYLNAKVITKEKTFTEMWGEIEIGEEIF